MSYRVQWHKGGADDSVLMKDHSLDECRSHARKLLMEAAADRVEIYDQKGRKVAQFQNMVRSN